jgi:hypothetical protein
MVTITHPGNVKPITKKRLNQVLRIAKNAIEGNPRLVRPVLAALRGNVAPTAAPASKPKENIIKRAAASVGTSIKDAATYVVNNKKQVTNKTAEVTWGATWRTGFTGLGVPFLSSLLNTAAGGYHETILKGAHYTSTMKEGWAQALNAIYPAVNTIADHPYISALIASGLWTLKKFTGKTS